MNFLIQVLSESWNLLLDSSVYILFGLLVSGLLRIFLSPGAVAHHFGRGRFRSVFKAALLGIPIPLCSCGVLPAAVSLRKQGANNGATTAFLISTPESGADSIAITYALLDPIMTVARPVVAFITAVTAGISENLLGKMSDKKSPPPDLSCTVDGCCDGRDCPPEEHRNHHSFMEKMTAGIRFAMTEVWDDIVGWFLVGLLLAGLITAAIPDDVFNRYLGGGLSSMLLMLAIGIPLYICATASTPIAAALILKGVSPGAALVFLLAGPATNMTSLTVLLGVLGKRGVAIYFTSIAVLTVLSGLALDWIYAWFDLSARAMA
ncbi:MAG: SO_0444 family Cu/Zn efflux transporter, partial [Desulfobacterales bacterium]|nr:SO_0444 family Cu/Zn efflux transporter [Desulfobacterales bacterium]